MVFGGIQKLSMVDYPGHMCATVFTIGCNLRCPFCHNAPLVISKPAELSGCIDEKDIIDYLSERKNMLDALCITGGEPLLHDDLVPFMEKVRNIGYRIKLDTNGTRPELLRKITEMHLCDYIAMDIKNCRSKYSVTAGTDVNLEAVDESISIIRSCGIPYEFRTTVCRPLHEEKDIVSIAEWLDGSMAYSLQQYNDDGEQIASEGFLPLPKDELTGLAESIKRHFERVNIRGI